MRRDRIFTGSDFVYLFFDTFHDQRNGYVFAVNPTGAQSDGLITNNTGMNFSWDGIWMSKARITDEGWFVEVAIPFTSIRFAEGESPEMGVAFYRSIRRKNEEVFWPHIPQEYRSGFMTVSQYATLSGLEDLRRGRYMELKPFGIAGVQKNAGEARAPLRRARTISAARVLYSYKWPKLAQQQRQLHIMVCFGLVESMRKQ